MNWPLIFRLSLFGVAMAIGTVFFIPSNVEPLFWLAIFIYCAYIIAQKAPGRYFLHGFLLSMVNSVWIVTAHVIFAETFMANRPEEAIMMNNLPMADSPRLMMLLVGPVVGAIFGLILGAFCWIASRFVRKKVVA